MLMALEQACDAESPVGLAVHTDSATVRDTAVAFAARRGLPLEIIGSQDETEGLEWRSYQIGVTAELSRLRGSMHVGKKPAVAAFVHTAFWRTSPGTERPMQESYIGAVLDAVSAAAGDDNLYCVGVGPRRNFKARRWWDALGVTAPVANGHAGREPRAARVFVRKPCVRARAPLAGGRPDRRRWHPRGSRASRLRPLASRPPRASCRRHAAVAMVGPRH